MCATLIGGMDRLKHEYTRAAKKQGIRLKTFTGKERNIKSMIGNPDLIIICTNKCSHKARIEAMQRAKSASIPVEQMHSCGVTSVAQCLSRCSVS